MRKGLQQVVMQLLLGSNWTPLDFINSSWYMTVTCTAVSCAARQNSCSIVFGCECRLGGRRSVGPNTVAKFLRPILLRLSCWDTLNTATLTASLTINTTLTIIISTSNKQVEGNKKPSGQLHCIKCSSVLEHCQWILSHKSSICCLKRQKTNKRVLLKIR